MGKKKDAAVPLTGSPSGPLKGNAFASLAKLGGVASAATPSNASAPGTAIPPIATNIPRAVVRYQRKGRGGKEVTLVEKLELRTEELAELCAQLKRGLGCGGHVEDSVIVLAGDQRSRVPAFLERRGVAKITIA